jgi:nicotinate dehydrogenase subunit A
MPQMKRFTLRVNGRERSLEAPPGRPLLSVLRDDLGLWGARFGCGAGQCGACVVLVAGEPVPSCVLPVEHAVGRDIVTVEGLARDDVLHPLQRAFLAEDALQCGYCTSGVLMAAAALLERNPTPDEDDIRDALAAHLCRCGVYARIVRAVERAAAGERPR